jgi:hypothetical protein
VSWPSGAAAIPGTNRLLVTYLDVCQFGGPTGERFVVAEYNPATNTLSGTTRVFTDLTGLSPRLTLGSPIFSNGYLYLFGSQCDGMSLGFCTGARSSWPASARPRRRGGTPAATGSGPVPAGAPTRTTRRPSSRARSRRAAWRPVTSRPSARGS